MQQGNMTFVRSLRSLRAEALRSVVSIGSFDGVHLGHQAVLNTAVARARDLNLTSVAMTFEPQPREFFAEERAPARLMRLREKIETLLEVGVDRVVCLHFNRELRSLTAAEFIVQVLVEGFRVEHLIVGDDFRFGCDRSGDLSMLRTFGERYDFSVSDTQTLETEGQRISSTLVRETIALGDFSRVAALLGRPYAIKGRVVHGQHLGRQLGFPTANVHLHRYRAPVSGVFAVRVAVANQVYYGAANVGLRPTIGDSVKPILEVHLLDFRGELYGQFISVEFLHKVRDEQKFDGLDALVVGIKDDIQKIRGWLKGHLPTADVTTNTGSKRNADDRL